MTSQNGRAFNEWLRAQLKAKKMSQRQLAQQSGVDHSTISRLIRGDRMPSLGTATKLARGLRELRDDADTPAIPRSRRLRVGQSHRARRVRAPRGRAPLGAAGPPDHGVLPRRADAPLRPRLPVRRHRHAARASTAPERSMTLAERRWPTDDRRRDQRHQRHRVRPERGWLGHRRQHGPLRHARHRPRGPLPEHFQGTTRTALHRPGLGDSERRRLGRRRSRFVQGAAGRAVDRDEPVRGGLEPVEQRAPVVAARVRRDRRLGRDRRSGPRSPRGIGRRTAARGHRTPTSDVTSVGSRLPGATPFGVSPT